MRNTIRLVRGAIASGAMVAAAGCGQATATATAATDPDAGNTADVAIAGTDAEVEVADVAHTDALNPDTGSPDGEMADSESVDVAPNTDAASVCVPANCDDGNPCTLDACNVASVCAHSAKPNGATCDDGNACTSGDVCGNGACVGKLTVKCAGSGCAACEPETGACTPAADGTECDDGNQCTMFDACAAGTCVGAPLSVTSTCDDSNACTVDACSAKQGCTHTESPGTCANNSACTMDACDPQSGGCVTGPATNCDDGNECTADGCTAPGGCTHAALADGSICTLTDVCVLGTGCVAGSCTSKGKKLFVEEYKAGSAWAVASLPDGFAIAGTTKSNSPWMVRTDLAGKSLWSESYVGTGGTSANFVAATSDGFLLSGGSPGATWVLRTDTAGKKLWQQTYAVGNGVPFATTQAGFVLAPTNVDGAGGRGLTGYDSTGLKSWSVNYGSTDSGYVSRVLVLADGYLLAGGKMDGTVKYAIPWLARTDSDGKILWEKTYGIGKQSVASVAALGDGFVLVGANNPTSGDGWLIRTDASGEEVWSEDYAIGPRVVIGVPDGYAVVSGVAKLTRADLFGNAIWTVSYSIGQLGETGLLALADGFVLAGTDGSGSSQLVRTDAWGHAYCKDAGGCVNVAPATCEDANACTLDLCTAAKGCTHTALAAGATCAPGKTCKSGTCAP